MSKIRVALAVVIAVSVLGGARATDVRAAGPSEMFFYEDYDPTIGYDVVQTWFPPDFDVRAVWSYPAMSLIVDTNGPGTDQPNFSVSYSEPGVVPTVGTVTSVGGVSLPGFDLSVGLHHWSTCSSNTMTIHEMEPTPDPTQLPPLYPDSIVFSKLSLSFEMICTNEDRGIRRDLRGEVRIGDVEPGVAVGYASDPDWGLDLQLSGQNVIGRPSPPARIELKNYGQAPITFGPTSLPADPKNTWAVVGNSCSGKTLAVAATCFIDVTLTAWAPRDEDDYQFLEIAASTARGSLSIHLRGKTFATTFKPINPTRLVDTRTPLGIGSILIDGKPRPFKVTNLAPGTPDKNVPADAVAVVGNLTVTAPSSSGYLSFTTLPEAEPTTSTINVPKGETRANGVILRLADNGRAAVTWSGAAGSSAHVLFDATGYFVMSESEHGWTPFGGNFAPSKIGRVLDTRVNLGITGPLRSRQPRTFTLPPGVELSAVAGNLTVTGSTGGGYVSIGPVATASPTTSTINFLKARTRANNTIVKLGSARSLSVTYVGPAGSTAHVIFDVCAEMLKAQRTDRFGYVPLRSSRVVDTRIGLGYSRGILQSNVEALAVTGDRFPSDPSRNIPVTSSHPKAILVTGNATMIKPTSDGYLTLPTRANDFSTSTINLERGGTYANGAVTPGGASIRMRFKGTRLSGTHFAFDANGYVVGHPSDL